LKDELPEPITRLKIRGKDIANETCTSWNTPKRGKILMEALDVINGERQDQYGNPEDSFKIIAEYWTAYLVAEGIIENFEGDPVQKLSPQNASIMMILFKIARMSGQADKEDNYRDAAGYLGIASDMIKK
jgi:hypothetical protein